MSIDKILLDHGNGGEALNAAKGQKKPASRIWLAGFPCKQSALFI